ncbi:MAG TPA: DUF2062 domain-containing protein [Bryobacteraceae bacterium]|jgi:hypothetical protein|nr:DUF2062 domain-containing protein [Bryobacteraceae bacterium]
MARLRAMLNGLSAEEAARIVAVGFVLGTVPVYGLPTLLCAGAALVLRLNLPALQIVNQLIVPVQLALLLPMVRVGAAVAGARPGLAGTLVHALAGWLCLCVPAGVALYFALIGALQWRRSSAPAHSK